LTTGILPANVFMLEHGGGLGVRLWNHWRAMLTSLRAAGEVLAITCSECAVLGKYLTYPALAVDPVHGFAVDVEGEFDFTLSGWSQARAIHLRNGDSHQYAVEFLGHRGQILHKVCLSPESRFDAFVEWVQVHQAVAEPEVVPWRRMPGGDMAEPAPESIEPVAHVFADPARLVDWLSAAIGRRLPIRALVGNDGIVQGHCFVPRSLREKGPWIFASSDEVGLHLDPEKIVHLVLHDIAPDEPSCWTLKAYGSSGELSLALAPTAPAHRGEWSAVARDVFPELRHR
jgi:putative heme degradation protein